MTTKQKKNRISQESQDWAGRLLGEGLLRDLIFTLAMSQTAMDDLKFVVAECKMEVESEMGK